MLLNPTTLKISDTKLGFDLPMINGQAVFQHEIITEDSRVIPASQGASVSGSLRTVVEDGKFTVFSSIGSDNGLIYCEVKL